MLPQGMIAFVTGGSRDIGDDAAADATLAAPPVDGCPFVNLQ
jgi:NAD(P)-dependent dehydrogenase (short-subunit alcohol dehydrogenase family)